MTAGTVMHGSKLPLTVWFWAAYLMATHSNGISARQLGRQLGLGSYKSAWLLCAKLRRAMVNPDRALLSGLVEVDETQIPYRTQDDPVGGGGGRSPDGKIQVVATVEIIDKAPGRLRLGVIPDASAASLHPFIQNNVATGTTLKTDGWAGYPGVQGYTHEPHTVGKMAAHIVLPWVHRVFSNLRHGRSASITASGPSIFRPISTNSSFVSTEGQLLTPPSSPCWASLLPENQPLTIWAFGRFVVMHALPSVPGLSSSLVGGFGRHRGGYRHEPTSHAGGTTLTGRRVGPPLLMPPSGPGTSWRHRRCGR